LTDQQIAGGVMWVLGSISFTVAMLVGFYRWLEPETYPPPAPVRAGDGPPAPAGVPSSDGAAQPTAALTP
jgi:hypothetical protein